MEIEIAWLGSHNTTVSVHLSRGISEIIIGFVLSSSSVCHDILNAGIGGFVQVSKWYCLMNIWNENDHLKETLLALKGCFDKIIVLDGAWSYYPYKVSEQFNEFHSSDGSIETVLDVTFTVPEVVYMRDPKGYITEVHKMNKGIELMDMEDGDYILFLDGHEVMEGDFRKQRKIIEEEAWNIGKMVIYNPKNHPPETLKSEWERLKKYHTQWRILRYHPQLHLLNKHWNFNVYQYGYLDEKVPDTYGVCEYIKFQHLQRNKERERIRNLFKQNMSPFRWHEDDYVQWRTEQKIEDGQV